MRAAKLDAVLGLCALDRADRGILSLRRVVGAVEYERLEGAPHPDEVDGLDAKPCAVDGRDDAHPAAVDGRVLALELLSRVRLVRLVDGRGGAVKGAGWLYVSTGGKAADATCDHLTYLACIQTNQGLLECRHFSCGSLEPLRCAQGSKGERKFRCLG